MEAQRARHRLAALAAQQHQVERRVRADLVELRLVMGAELGQLPLQRRGADAEALRAALQRRIAADLAQQIWDSLEPLIATLTTETDTPSLEEEAL